MPPGGWPGPQLGEERGRRRRGGRCRGSGKRDWKRVRRKRSVDGVEPLFPCRLPEEQHKAPPHGLCGRSSVALASLSSYPLFNTEIHHKASRSIVWLNVTLFLPCKGWVDFKRGISLFIIKDLFFLTNIIFSLSPSLSTRHSTVVWQNSRSTWIHYNCRATHCSSPLVKVHSTVDATILLNLTFYHVSLLWAGTDNESDDEILFYLSIQLNSIYLSLAVVSLACIILA